MFRKTALEKGLQIYQNRRVENITEVNGTYKGSVLEKRRYEVSFSIKDGKLKAARCKCPVAKGMGLCEHMAAVLYAVENKERDIEKMQLEEARKRAEYYKREAEQQEQIEAEKAKKRAEMP